MLYDVNNYGRNTFGQAGKMLHQPGWRTRLGSAGRLASGILTCSQTFRRHTKSCNLYGSAFLLAQPAGTHVLHATSRLRSELTLINSPRPCAAIREEHHHGSCARCLHTRQLKTRQERSVCIAIRSGLHGRKHIATCQHNGAFVSPTDRILSSMDGMSSSLTGAS